MSAKTNILLCLLTVLLTSFAQASPQTEDTPIVIAHRGASGYLPEHTLEAKALAYGMHADYIEQDLVLSKDNHLIVMHDIYLDSVTDVARKFPGRARKDGHFYTIDFTLSELKQLRVAGPFISKLGQGIPKYPARFPLWKSRFELATLEEELELIQGLNQSLGYGTGIYPEIKKPYFHRAEGRDISRVVLETLKRYGYTSRAQKVYLQSFDAEELQYIHNTLMPELKMDLSLIQLIAETEWEEKRVQHSGEWENYEYGWMRTPEGLKKIAGYAAGIGPWFPMLIREEKDSENFTPNQLAAHAHQLGLEVHPYTFRADPQELLLLQQIPGAPESFDALLAVFLNEIGVDGVFTDHPDKVRQFIAEQYQRAVVPQATQ